MRKAIFIYILIHLGACDAPDHQERINNTLDSLHYFASKADQKTTLIFFRKMLSFLEQILKKDGPLTYSILT